MKNNENGRSMVEMLGVLALIGILSLTGIYGYTLAMRRHRVNEIVQVASILASEAQSANGGIGECLELSDYASLPANPAGVNLIMVADNTVEGAPVSISIQMGVDDANILCGHIEQAFSGLYSVECTSSGITRCREL